MAELVNLNAFMWACEKAAYEPVSPKTLVWRDLGLFGEEWWDFSVTMLRYLCMQYHEGSEPWKIYDFIPAEHEVSVLGLGYIGKRKLRDITLHEVYEAISDRLALRT